MNYKTMYVIIAVNDWKIKQMNVKIVFLYNKIHENVFVVQFTSFEQRINQICKLNKTLYDLKQFSKVWFETLIKFLFLDYVSLNVEFNVFMKNDIMIIIYVNDLIFTKHDSTIISRLKNVLNERFEMNDLNSCIYYLNMMIFKIRCFKLLFLNQNVYVEQILQHHEIWNCKLLIIFINVSCRLIKIFDEYIDDKRFRINYQLIVKSLMYIMLKIRFDITYFISIINHYVFNLIQIHWQAIKRIFRYIRKTYQIKLMFRETLKSLKNYTNSNWTKNQDIKRLISEYAFNVNSEIINWFSKRQSIVTLFICEIEYTKQTLITKEIICLRNLMIQLTCDVEYFQAIIIYENNQNVIALIKNFQFHARRMHIDIQTHFIKKNDRRFHRFNLCVYRSNDNWRFNKIFNQKQIYSISRRFKNWIITLSRKRLRDNNLWKFIIASRQQSVKIYQRTSRQQFVKIYHIFATIIYENQIMNQFFQWKLN
jgi:hypothetical protein